jgi:hypothetical protein
MIANNRTSLDNRIIRKQADEAMAAGCITGEEHTKIGSSYPVDFYAPNIFICIGLFILTLIILTFSVGLFFLVSGSNNDSIVSLLIFSGLVFYCALEFVIYQRKHFRSGVDYALLWMSAGLLYAGLCLTANHISFTSQCIILFIISFLFTLRFANFLMTLLAYTSVLALVFNIANETVRAAQLMVPFIIMAVSVAGWLLSNRFYTQEKYRHYRLCLTAIKFATLVSFYLGGNYFVVRELDNYMFGIFHPAGESISIGWLFWMLTVITPVFYLYKGIQKKNSVFLWTGMVLTAATVFTIRHYYSILPAEWAMLLGGILIIAMAYGLIKYLRIPRNGFTSRENSDRHLLEKLQIESLVITETFAAPSLAPAPASDFQFGGGSGGGGGAGGQF